MNPPPSGSVKCVIFNRSGVRNPAIPPRYFTVSIPSTRGASGEGLLRPGRRGERRSDSDPVWFVYRHGWVLPRQVSYCVCVCVLSVWPSWQLTS